MIQKDTEEQAALFSALADLTRLKIVKLLCCQREPDALCVNAMAGILGISQSAVSQHLRVLKAIGLVKGQRRGYHIHYSINRDAMQHCQELVLSALNTEIQIEKESCESYCSDRRRQDVSRD